MAIFYEVPKRCYNQYGDTDLTDIQADPMRTSMLMTTEDRPFKDLLRADQAEE